jgi:hypothetical protein
MAEKMKCRMETPGRKAWGRATTTAVARCCGHSLRTAAHLSDRGARGQRTNNFVFEENEPKVLMSVLQPGN